MNANGSEHWPFYYKLQKLVKCHQIIYLGNKFLKRFFFLNSCLKCNEYHLDYVHIRDIDFVHKNNTYKAANKQYDSLFKQHEHQW